MLKLQNLNTNPKVLSINDVLRLIGETKTLRVFAYSLTIVPGAGDDRSRRNVFPLSKRTVRRFRSIGWFAVILRSDVRSRLILAT